MKAAMGTISPSPWCRSHHEFALLLKAAMSTIAAMKSPIVSCAMVLTLALGALNAIYADSATWNLNPISNDWNTAANWTPATVPNGPSDTATFDISKITSVSISATTQVNSVVFNPGASAFRVRVPASLMLNISGNGLTNNSATIQNFVTAGEQATIQFSQNATAGSLISITNKGGLTSFVGSATAGTAMIINNGFPDLGTTAFFEQSSAGSGTIINNGGTSFSGGLTEFFDTATAGDGTFIVNGSAVQDGVGGQGELIFQGSSTAGNGTFTVNGGDGAGASNGEVFFYDTASAGEGTFTLNGGFLFFAAGSASTAANATLIANRGPNGGALIMFAGASTGGTARVEVFGNSELQIDSHDPPGLTIGSLEGDGHVHLGANSLTVGTNNLSTTFSGVIQGSNGGPLSKVGGGTLILSGNNRYGSGTMISDGVLKINNESGSGTGTEPVSVLAGTLGGSGIIAGSVTVGTGSGTGAFLAPAIGSNVQATLTIQSALTFKADSTYTYTFRKNRNGTRTDQVIANGVTINSGAMIVLSGHTSVALRQGLVLTVISNTSANPISGTFSNLPDGGIVTVNGTNLQASYEGGDGNDLTLTVVP